MQPGEDKGRRRAQEAAAKKGEAEEGGGITRAGRYTSVYYETLALPKHPEAISDDWIERVVAQPERFEIKPINGTIAYWAYIPEFGNCIRVVLPETDGTLLNRFPDSQERTRRLRRQGQP